MTVFKNLAFVSVSLISQSIADFELRFKTVESDLKSFQNQSFKHFVSIE